MQEGSPRSRGRSRHGGASGSSSPPAPAPPQQQRSGGGVRGPSRLQMAVSQRLQRKPPEPLRRAVADCLSASHQASVPPLTSEAVRTLQDYLANPSTIHFAYIVLLEHALAERDRSPPVVMKCVSLLKRYLFRYVPPITTLQQIDSFCAGLIGEYNLATGKRATTRTPSVNEPQASTCFPPSVTTSVFASEALIKSLTYVRAVVARHLPGFSLQQSSTASLKPLVPVTPSPRNRLLTPHYGQNGLQPAFTDEKESARPATLAVLGLETIEDGNIDYIALDVLPWRWIARKGKQIWVPSPVMMDSGGIARPHVENLDNLEQGAAALLLENRDQLLRASTATTIGDASVVKSHLRAVAASKRVKPVAHSYWGSETVSTVRKRPRPLFQYRCYSKQQPLRLSDADIEEVITAVCSDGIIPSNSTLALPPPLPSNQGGIVPETANVAASVLIKLIIDMYLTDARTAAPLTLFILQGMLNSSHVAVRVRAFDLVLNLGVHAHLLEPIQSEDQENVQDASPFPSGGASRVPRDDGSKHYGTPRAVGEFETWLLTILSEMMLFLVQLEETEEGVWAAAMSNLLYLVCDRGRIRRKRLDRVDIRVLRILLDISRENAWAEEIHSRLIRMISNVLYILPSGDDSQYIVPVLDLEKLEIIGGIELICKEYALANNPEAQRNLLAIIFEYLVCELRNKVDAGKQYPTQDEVQAVATSLVLSGAPESLSIAFRQKLRGIGGRLAKSITKALDRDIANGRLNPTLLEEVTSSIDLLIGEHASLHEEFRDLLSITMAKQVHAETVHVSHLEARAWATLHALLHSSRVDYRQHGFSWLNQLLATEVECAYAKPREESHHQHCLLKVLEHVRIDLPDDKTSAVHLFFGLLKSRRSYVRRGFLTVLEHLLSQCQRPVSAEGGGKSSVSENHASTVIRLMNGALWQFISANDTHRVNILQMCNLMLSQICIRWLPRPGNKPASYSLGNSDADKKEHRHSWDKTLDPMNIPSKHQTVNSCAGGAVVLSSMAALFLREEAAASKFLATRMPTTLFYWPLMQLAGATMDDMTLGIAVGSKGGGNVPGGASDVRAALLLLLIGKCTVQQSALEEVGGEEFFRSLLDDTDARMAYYTASFLIKRMMAERPDDYQRILHNLVFKAQQSNNEKLLENPYLQMRGILQLATDLKTPASLQDDT